MIKDHREKCYQCYRPRSSCMCEYIQPIETQTHIVILMHPKEFKRTKNGTGHFTHRSLSNSSLYVGIDFTQHKEIKALLNDANNACYVLYPDTSSINLNTTALTQDNKRNVIFLIDSTWPCSRAMLRASPNIDALPKVSFTHTKSSAFIFKEQPKTYCLSTMESTLCLLELLNTHQHEQIPTHTLKSFLQPFHKMVAYQLSCQL